MDVAVLQLLQPNERMLLPWRVPWDAAAAELGGNLVLQGPLTQVHHIRGLVDSHHAVRRAGGQHKAHVLRSKLDVCHWGSTVHQRGSLYLEHRDEYGMVQTGSREKKKNSESSTGNSTIRTTVKYSHVQRTRLWCLEKSDLYCHRNGAVCYETSMTAALTQWLSPLCLSLDSPTISSHTAAVLSKEQEARTWPNSGWAQVTLHTDPLCVWTKQTNKQTCQINKPQHVSLCDKESKT